MSFGFLVSGPLMHGWYKVLDTAIPAPTLMAAIPKLCLDQLIAAPILVGSFFVYLGVKHASAEAGRGT